MGRVLFPPTVDFCTPSLRSNYSPGKEKTGCVGDLSSFDTPKRPRGPECTLLGPYRISNTGKKKRVGGHPEREVNRSFVVDVIFSEE